MAYINGKEILFSSVVNVDDTRKIPHIRSALISKGGGLVEGATYEDVPNAILDLPVGDASYVAVEDNDIAYKKSILSGAAPLVNLKSIGGMTQKSNQLLPTGYWDRASQSGNYSGMTFTNHGDGSFTFDGTCEGTSIELFTVPWDNYPENFKKYSLYGDYLSFGATLPEGVECYLYLDGGSDTGSGVLLTGSGGLTGASVDWRIASIYLSIPSGTVFNKLTLKPMLNLGTTALPYEPYFEGLRDSKVTALKVYGANLFDPSICVNNNFIDNGDGTYTMKRNGDNRFAKWADFYIPAKTKFYVSGKVVKAGAAETCIYFRFADRTTGCNKAINGARSSYTSDKDIVAVCLYMVGSASSSSSESIVSDLIISYGAVPYSPYKEPTTYAIPEAVQNLDALGHGFVDSSTNEFYTNTVDLENKKYINYIPEKIVLDGKNVKLTGFDTSFGVPRGMVKISNRVAPSARALDITRFTVRGTNASGYAYLYSGTASTQVILCLDGIASLSEFNKWLESNNVELVYAIKEPDVKPLSTELEDFLNLIEVEPGGWIEFINERSNAIPSELSYIRRI